MGHRANILSIENGVSELYYCHWCALTLPIDLFWGPDYALPFVRRQRLEEDSGWLDQAFAEGGALVDVDKRVLLVFGGEDLQGDLPLQRVYLTMLQTVWPGWQVDWARQGIVDIADYAGVSRSVVMREWMQDEPIVALDPPSRPDRIPAVASFIFADGEQRLLPLDSTFSYLLAGVRIVDLARNQPIRHHLRIDAGSAVFPYNGFHADVPAQQLSYWNTDTSLVPDQIAPYWPGWQIDWLGDRWEAHVALTGGMLQIDDPPKADVVVRLCRQLLSDHSDGFAFFQRLIESQRREGHEVMPTPYASRSDPQEIDLATRERILAGAIAALPPEWGVGKE